MKFLCTIIHLLMKQCCSRRCTCRSAHWHRLSQKLLRPIELDVRAGTWRKVQENSGDHHPFTYIGSLVSGKSRVMDDKIPMLNIDRSSALKGPWRKVQKISLD
jgi:hypothetical protein